MIKLENQNLSITYDEGTKQFTFTDKRINKEWKQVSIAGFNPTLPVVNDNVISYDIIHDGATYKIEMALENDAEVLYTISADKNAPMLKNLNFPLAIIPNDDKHYLLQTDSEGLLLPVTDDVYPLEPQAMYGCSGGPCMSWMGMVDGDLKSGYMSVYETPCDAEINPHKEDGLITFDIIWQTVKDTFGYERKQRMVFFDKGGYVAQCKFYRNYIWAKNQVTTLKSRLERFPAMEKMMGAIHMYVWDNARKDEFLEELKESGIDKAFVLWDPNHLPYPTKSFSDTAKKLNYAIGSYNLFTDIHEDTPENHAKQDEIPLLLNIYKGQFEYLTAKKKDGSTYSNSFGNYNCPKAIFPEIKKRMDIMMRDYEFEAQFLDVYLANGLYECYDERHPLTREGYMENIINNFKFIADEYGIFLGGELGADFAGSLCSFAHGTMTLHRIWWQDKPTMTPGTIYYTGNWDNNERPTQMIGTRTATPKYLKYCINEYTRVPLYELVHHDAVVTTWRWEDCNHHYPEIWWKKDLFNVLYGTHPLWSLCKESFETHKETFVESYNKITPWLSKVCYDELVDHSFVSADRKVQESIFSSGKKVVVNFGNQDYDYNGTVIPAKDFITFE